MAITANSGTVDVGVHYEKKVSYGQHSLLYAILSAKRVKAEYRVMGPDEEVVLSGTVEDLMDTKF
jgi:hypothetical protein